ncbi:MAG: type IV pilin protein [Steroidobacteraceae bacterium]|jgi:type IV pilus assembly protein PilE|nr:type IV pilin protein [Steroidobacteraceae bacterium]
MSARHAPQTSITARAAGGAWRKMRGITLIELMTVVAVLAILGTIAVSSYRSYLVRTNRTEARMALLRIQAAQEKFFLQNNRYATADELGGLGATPGGYYTIDLQNLTDTTYTARARAAAGQLADAAACQTLTIDHTGARTPNDASGCWR